MPINLTIPQTTQELLPRITVVGIGGAGCNAVNNMINANLEGVEFLVVNTDGQSLSHSLAPRKIQLGSQVTQGLGAGSKPEMGKLAAEESMEEVLAELNDSNMVFITAGMGGGTGTGAAPIIAKAAKERGILTVGVVTKPFSFEGQRRMEQADEGISALQAYVDTLIVIPNQNLFRLANERTTFADAFGMADAVLHQGVCGVTDLMIKPGIINLDFADIRSVMTEMGKAMMGTGEATGENRAIEAAEAAINNPLLDDTSMQGAQALLINITGGMDMTLFEVDEAANRIRREVDEDATIIFGSAFDEKLDGIIRVSVVATGFEAAEQGSLNSSAQSFGSSILDRPQVNSIPGLFSSTPPAKKELEAETSEINKVGGFADELSPPIENYERNEAQEEETEIQSENSSNSDSDNANQSEEPLSSNELSSEALDAEKGTILEEKPLVTENLPLSSSKLTNNIQQSKKEKDNNPYSPEFKHTIEASDQHDKTDNEAKSSFIPEPTKPMSPVSSYAPTKQKSGLMSRISKMWGATSIIESQTEKSASSPPLSTISGNTPSLSPRSAKLENDIERHQNEVGAEANPSLAQNPKILDLPSVSEEQATIVFKETVPEEDTDELDIPAFLRRQAN